MKHIEFLVEYCYDLLMALNFIWYYTVQIPRQNVLAFVVGKYVAIDNADNPIPKIPIRYNINTFFNKILFDSTN